MSCHSLRLHTFLTVATGAEGDQSDTVSHVIKATRKGGNIALIGDYFFTTNQFPIGALMEKAITLRGGQLYAQKVIYSIVSLRLAVNHPLVPSISARHHS